jgi:hypothetical protein
MSYQVNCPHCKIPLNVSEKAFGRTVPCPACGQSMMVPQASPESNSVDMPLPQFAGATQSTHQGTPPSPMPLPSQMPPIPPAGGAFDFLNGAVDARVSSTAPLDNAAARLAEEHASAAEVSIAQKRRPALLVWIIFYWLLYGVSLAIAGIALQFSGGIIGGAAAAIRETGMRSDAPRGLAELLGFLGMLSFHIGLVAFVACYGLWSFRAWALPLAKVMAVVFAVLGVLQLVGSLITLQGIVASLTSCAIQFAVLVYFFGPANVAGRLQRYSSRLSRPVDSEWEGYER